MKSMHILVHTCRQPHSQTPLQLFSHIMYKKTLAYEGPGNEARFCTCATIVTVCKRKRHHIQCYKHCKLMCVSEVPQKFSGDSFISLTSLPTCRPLARFPLLASYAFKKSEGCCSPLEWKSKAIDCLALISSFEWEREKESLLKLNLARVVSHFCAGIGAWEAITELRANAFTQLHVSFYMWTILVWATDDLVDVVHLHESWFLHEIDFFNSNPNSSRCALKKTTAL